jgi:effector-binding domain-containing protein
VKPSEVAVDFDEPTIERRAERPYVALEASITMDGFGVIGGLFGELFAWLGERGIDADGPPFIRYLEIDMERQLDIHVAVPVAGSVPNDDRVIRDALPAGPYVTLLYDAQSPEEHIAANAHLQRWAQAQGLRWKKSFENGHDRWGGRFEISPDPESQEEGEQSFVAYLVEE